MRYLRTPLFASSVLTAVLGIGCGDDATYVPPPLADAGDDAALSTATATPTQNPTSALSHTATAAPSNVPVPSTTPTTTAAPQPSDDVDSGIPSATPSTDPSSAPTDVPDAQVTDTGTTPSASSSSVVLPDGGTPVGGGEPIPEDLYPVTEFDFADGYMNAYFTFDAFENIVPDVDEGVAAFSIPFDAVLVDPNDVNHAQAFGWGFNLNPSPQDFTGGTLVVRARVASGLTTDPAKPGALQLFASSDGGGGVAGYAHLNGNDWQVIEFDLDDPDNSPWGGFTSSALTSVMFTFHADNYNGEVTDADVAAAVIEVDWLGIRPAPVVTPPDGGAPDTGVIDTDGGPVETDGGVIETDSGVIETDSGMGLPDGGAIETDSGAADGGSEPSIPVDVTAITEFSSAAGYVDAYGTLDAFETITPSITDGIATFDVPFGTITDKFQWDVPVNPSPQDLSAGVLVVYARISGITVNPYVPGVIQLYGMSSNGGGNANWLNVVPDEWHEYQFPIGTSGGWGSYDPSMISSVAFSVHANNYAAVDEDMIDGLIEVDWVGVRYP